MTSGQRVFRRIALIVAFAAIAVACARPDLVIVAESQPSTVTTTENPVATPGTQSETAQPEGDTVVGDTGAIRAITESFARHLRIHGPLPTTVEPSPLPDTEASCVADRFTSDYATLLEAERIDEADDVARWFDGVAGAEARLAFNTTLVLCLSDATRARHQATIVDALDYQRFTFAADDIRCITDAALRTSVLSEIWTDPPATSLIFELSSNRRGELDAARVVWADALMAGLDECVGLGRLVAVDLTNIGVDISPRTAVCMDAAGTGVSLAEGWAAGSTLDEIGDPVKADLLACLDDREQTQLLESVTG